MVIFIELFTGLSCVCSKDSEEKYEYDNILQQPICDEKCANTSSCTRSRDKKFQCQYKYLIFSDYNLKTKGIQIYRNRTTSNSSCECNLKQNTIFKNEFCIPNSLLKDYQTYNNFHMLPSVYDDIKFLSFFCQILKNATACNHLANLCVLTFYNLEKNSPCNLFFITTQIDDLAGNDNDQYLKVRPYLFYKKGKPAIESIEKIIYNEFELGGKMNFTQVGYGLRGNLLSYEFVEWGDFNLCTKYTTGGDEDRLKFGSNTRDKCKISVRKLIREQDEPVMKFYDLYLNYADNGVRYLKGVPVLIRNIFSHDQVYSINKTLTTISFRVLFLNSENIYRRMTMKIGNLLNVFLSLTPLQIQIHTLNQSVLNPTLTIIICVNTHQSKSLSRSPSS